MPEEEIDLRDYINVVFKRKKVILTVLFVSVAVTAIVSFLSPRVYKISMILEPPSQVTDVGEKVYLDSPVNMKAAVEGGTFNPRIIKALSLITKRPLKFKVSQPKKLEILKISIEREEEKVKDGIRILNQLLKHLSETYYDKLEFVRNNIEREISIVSSDIGTKNNNVKSREKMLKILGERESELISEIEGTKYRKKLQDRDILLASYINQIGKQLVDVKIEEEEIRISIKNLQSQIGKLQLKIESLNAKKDRINDVRLIQEPMVSSSPIRPKKRQNIAIAMVLGVMLGVFIAFLQEFWEKTRHISPE